MSRNSLLFAVVISLAGCLAWAPTPALGQTPLKALSPEKLKFEISVVEGDPFSKSFEHSNKNGKLKVRRGQTVVVEIRGTPLNGHYTYPITEQTDENPGNICRVKWSNADWLKPIGESKENEPHLAKAPKPVGRYFKHDAPFTWRQELIVLPSTPPGKKDFAVFIEGQVCKESCVPYETILNSSFVVSEETADPVPGGVLDKLNEPRPEPWILTLDSADKVKNRSRAESVAISPAAQSNPAAAAGTGSSGRRGRLLIDQSPEQYAKTMDRLASKVTRADSGTSSDINGASDTLLGFVLAGVFWGFISLITPCVFPMIPITVSFFLKQSEKEHQSALKLASIYAGTIVVVLTLAAAFLLHVFRYLSVNPFMNYGLGILFVYFALSLFGMYEIELPSFLSQFTSSKEEKGGVVGTVFMALTFTIISFACVAPFLGGFGGTAAAERPLWHNLLGGFAFSATFAAPFFVLALFPSMLKKLPKSGSWLSSVKVVMGFLELAAALKFMRAGELQYAGTPWLFTFDFVLGIWIALALLCGLYLIGTYRLPHDSPADHVGVPRLVFAALFLGLACYLAPAMFKSGAEGGNMRPTGEVYAWVDSFLLPEAREADSTGDLDAVLTEARDHLAKTGRKKRIFIDFTGEICTNCRLNEENVLQKPGTKELLAEYSVVQIYTDTVPFALFAPQRRTELGGNKQATKPFSAANYKFQNDVFNAVTLPMYAIVEAKVDGGIEVRGVYGEGLIRDVEKFRSFLREHVAR